MNRIHANPIAQERAARAPPSGVDEQQRNAVVRVGAPIAQNELIDDARLPGTPRAGKPDDDGLRRRGRAQIETRAHRFDLGASLRVILEPGDDLCHGPGCLAGDALDLVGNFNDGAPIARCE